MAPAPRKKQTRERTVTMIRASATNWARESYFSYLPKRRRYRVVLLVVAFVWAIAAALQLAYPEDRGLPTASVNGISLRGQTTEHMTKIVTEQFAATKVTLTVGKDKSVTYPLSSFGAVPNTEDMVRQLRAYPFWQRLIPGTIFLQPSSVTYASVYFDKEPFDEFSKARSKELSFPPRNARLAIKDGALTATAEMAGSTVTMEELEKTISLARLKLGEANVVEAPSKRTPPERSLQDLAKVSAQAEAILDRRVIITAGGKEFEPDEKTIASWLVLNTDASNTVTLSVDTGRVKSYLKTINDAVGVPAGMTNIDLVDGREARRSTGKTGRAIDSAELAVNIEAELLAGGKDAVRLSARFVDVLPSVIYDHKYTATEAGLRAYVKDAAASKNMHIVVQQLEGKKWYAAAREHESIPSGSTYKLFVSLVLFDRINKGQTRWNEKMMDTSVAGCFDRMTVDSTNPCAENWIAQYGRQYINDFVYARGFSRGTSFTTGSATQTTAADLNKYMIGFHDGTLVSGDNRDRLMHNLSRHPYKYGIAAGSAAADNQVFDKVGFLWDYIHDTAIVKHPKGTYILTILTKGQSYGAIAAVTREIERIMYP